MRQWRKYGRHPRKTVIAVGKMAIAVGVCCRAFPSLDSPTVREGLLARITSCHPVISWPLHNVRIRKAKGR
jgi:hypothetical protein